MYIVDLQPSHLSLVDIGIVSYFIVLQVTMLQLFTISHDLVFLFPTAAESHYRTRGQYAYTFIYIIYNIYRYNSAYYISWNY